MLIPFPALGTRPPVWVNPAHVAYVEQINPERAKIHFVGGGLSVEVAEPLASVVGQLNGARNDSRYP